MDSMRQHALSPTKTLPVQGQPTLVNLQFDNRLWQTGKRASDLFW